MDQWARKSMNDSFLSWRCVKPESSAAGWVLKRSVAEDQRASTNEHPPATGSGAHAASDRGLGSTLSDTSSSCQKEDSPSVAATQLHVHWAAGTSWLISSERWCHQHGAGGRPGSAPRKQERAGRERFGAKLTEAPPKVSQCLISAS